MPLALRKIGAFALALAPLIVGAAEQARSVGGFEAVAVRDAVTLVLKPAALESVHVSADETLLAQVETRVVTRRGVPTLEVGLQRGARTFGRGTVSVTVGFAWLSALPVSGSGDVRGEGLASAALKVALSVSGSVRLAGRSDRLVVEIAGSGDVDTSALAADQVAVDIAGSGDARVDARKTLAVAIAGSGDVAYRGDAVVTSSIAGSGKVRRR